MDFILPPGSFLSAIYYGSPRNLFEGLLKVDRKDHLRIFYCPYNSYLKEKMRGT
jgi:hypothetical protein